MRKPGTVQVGIVGCGNIAATYVATLRMFDFIHVKSVSDAMPAAATKLAAEFDLAAPPVDALVADPDIEVVINLTMPVAHAEISAKALRAGKHVYSEKPLGVSMAEAEPWSSSLSAMASVLAAHRIHSWEAAIRSSAASSMKARSARRSPGQPSC